MDVTEQLSRGAGIGAVLRGGYPSLRMDFASLTDVSSAGFTRTFPARAN
jgi:hypothetical protein